MIEAAAKPSVHELMTLLHHRVMDTKAVAPLFTLQASRINALSILKESRQDSSILPFLPQALPTQPLTDLLDNDATIDDDATVAEDGSTTDDEAVTPAFTESYAQLSGSSRATPRVVEPRRRTAPPVGWFNPPSCHRRSGIEANPSAAREYPQTRCPVGSVGREERLMSIHIPHLLVPSTRQGPVLHHSQDKSVAKPGPANATTQMHAYKAGSKHNIIPSTNPPRNGEAPFSTQTLGEIQLRNIAILPATTPHPSRRRTKFIPPFTYTTSHSAATEKIHQLEQQAEEDDAVIDEQFDLLERLHEQMQILRETNDNLWERNKQATELSRQGLEVGNQGIELAVKAMKLKTERRRKTWLM
ncbi:hypothetical protein PMZ80_006831 [Knufia obscura]|uniref:t-SNARE coiled-coil homology domain-containing protein n=1 Tax=Knufia obscura TaxID=1635080 RepID=A0ABR0RJE7_9EURO|nr:hypothetical protein PMZ80_006831 [Knufia obscura]